MSGVRVDAFLQDPVNDIFKMTSSALSIESNFTEIDVLIAALDVNM